MDKQTTGARVDDGGLVQLVARVGGFRTPVTRSSTEANEKISSEAQTIKTLAQQRWPNTFRLDCTVLGHPIGRVTRQLTWEHYLGRPMKQPVPGTCALVACTVCVEAIHRLEHEKLYGEASSFAAVVCHQLFNKCLDDGVWTDEGAYVYKVLNKIQQMGGVPATTTNAPTLAPCILPLSSWNRYSLPYYHDDSGSDALYNRVAELLDTYGPCVGELWVCPWYYRFDADADDTLVYRGCGQNDDDRSMSEQLYRGQVGWHAVVCFAYRFCGQHMHVQVLDNHSATGPRRWIDAEEFHVLYTLSSV